MSLRYIIIFFFSVILSANLLASHIVGGEIYYQFTSGDNYIVYLKVYRDCNTGNAQFDDPAYISIFDGSNNYLQTIEIYTPTITEVEPDIDNPCLIVPEGICVEEAVYITTVYLPPVSGGYSLTYQRCCRNSTIDNIVDPSNVGSTYTVQIPDTSIASTNNSPYYNDFPPIVICNNEPLNFDHSATDPDGDSLVYSICDPYTYDNSLGAKPYQASSPPYNFETFLPPYSGTYPLSASPALAIDSQTGLLTGTPNYEGQFVVAICVSEYRDGVLLSTNKRDFQFNVTNCVSKAVSVTAYIESGDTAVIEGCGNIIFDFSRSSNLDKDLVLYISTSGTATNGIDYSLLPDSIIIPAGQSAYQIIVSTNFDNIDELLENATITISNDTACIEEAVATANIINSEEISLNIEASSPYAAIICKGDEAVLTAHTNGGDGPLSFLWSNGENDSTITVKPDSTQSYYLLVTDSCGNHIESDTVMVYVLCEVNIPNVFTPNGDEYNEVFYIENLYMHPNSELKIYNRWGRMLYKNESYDNSWDGENLSDGTYYYIFDTPERLITQENANPIQQFYYEGLPLVGFVSIVRSAK
jgi:gliding motility-associated-like protein